VIIVDVFVPGAAKTKGSMEVRNRATGAMKESVVDSSRWRALMAQAMRDDIEQRRHVMRSPDDPYRIELPYPGAVSVTVEAYLAPPSAVQRWLWPIWNRAGDLDKLVRNVLDAIGSTSKNAKMNGGAIVDDNLVCRIVATKVVAGERSALGDPRHAGVRIVVETL
jgi:Holliday junction resolvase RusA-like endonuclease